MCIKKLLLRVRTELYEKIQLLAKQENISINNSDKNFIIKNNKIIMPFSIIKNIANNVSEEILNEREKSKFKDFYDFMKRCYGKSINKRVITSLIEVGAFDEFNLNRKMTINNLDIILNLKILFKYI